MTDAYDPRNDPDLAINTQFALELAPVLNRVLQVIADRRDGYERAEAIRALRKLLPNRARTLVAACAAVGVSKGMALEAHRRTCQCGGTGNLYVQYAPWGDIDQEPPAARATIRFILAVWEDDHESAVAIFESIPVDQTAEWFIGLLFHCGRELDESLTDLNPGRPRCWSTRSGRYPRFNLGTWAQNPDRDPDGGQ